MPVVRAFDTAGVKYTHHPERLDKQPGGGATFHPERIDAGGQEAFDGLWGFSYVFAHGRLEEVRFMAARRRDELAAGSF